MRDIDSRVRNAVSEIARRARALHRERCFIVAVSGIDGAGKTTFARAVDEGLWTQGLSVYVVHLDDWHTAPETRFGSDDPGGHFYRRAYRFDELFELLVEPVRMTRSLTLRTTLRRLSDGAEFKHEYRLADLDVLILDGIFLLKTELRSRYDFSLWVDCSFETALTRAIARNQEGLLADELVRDYTTVYFPAQEVHMRLDDPRGRADLVLSSE